MTTRAIQIELLLDGVFNPTSGEHVSAGTAYFYEAGTTTAKNVWTEKEKTNPYTSYTLNGVGGAQLYGEGNYKIVIKDSSGATVQTLDNIRLEYPYYGIRSVSSATVTMLSQDDFLLCDTTSNAITINALAAASWTRPLKIQRIAGSNNITFDPSGAETIDGSATLVISSDAIVEIITDGSNLRSAGFRSSFADTDNDTKIQVEESADEDTIRFDVGGIEVATMDSTGVHGIGVIEGDGSSGRSLRTSSFNIYDGTSGTSVQVELISNWNGEAVGPVDNITKGSTVSNVTLSADGHQLVFESGALTYTPLAAIAGNVNYNLSGTALSLNFNVGTGTLVANFYNAATGGAVDLTTLVDTGSIFTRLVYLTSD